MKFSIVVIIAVAVAFAQNVKLTNAETDPYKLLTSECAAQEGATDLDVEMVGMEIPHTKSGQCLHACIFERLGLIKNNKIDVETTMEMFKAEITDDPDTVKIALEIANECIDVTDEERCEATYKIIVCTEEASRARGLVFDR